MKLYDSEHASASWRMAYQNDAIGFLARGHWPPALESLLRTLRFSEPEVWLGESLSAPSLDRALERWRQVFQKLPLRETGYTGESGKVDFWLNTKPERLREDLSYFP